MNGGAHERVCMRGRAHEVACLRWGGAYDGKVCVGAGVRMVAVPKVARGVCGVGGVHMRGRA